MSDFHTANGDDKQPPRVPRRRLLQAGIGAAGLFGLGAYLGKDRVRREVRRPRTTDPLRGGGRFADDVGKQIKGYASADSYQAGDELVLFVTVSDRSDFAIEIYETGWFDGARKRLVHAVDGLSGIEQSEVFIESESGRIHCQWDPSYAMAVPREWSSGVYLARLRRNDGYINYIPFVVRDVEPTAPLVYVHPTTTYQAYNAYPLGAGGKSLYDFNSGGEPTGAGTQRAYTVSGDRPFSGAGDGGLFTFGMSGIFYLNRKGWEVSFVSDSDVHRNPGILQGAKCVVSGGHDEYWSSTRYDAFAAARDTGTSLFFMGANVAYWQIRYGNTGGTGDTGDTGEGGRTRSDITCYKSLATDPESSPDLQTDLTRVVGRPEQALVGVGLMNMVADTESIDDRGDFIAENTDHWAYGETNMVDGDDVVGILGNETDARDPQQPMPDSLSYTRLGVGTISGDMGDTIAETVIYQAPSGAWVFASGTLAWEEALDLEDQLYDARIEQMTTTILERMLA